MRWFKRQLEKIGYHVFNTSLVKIIYGIQMRQGFKQGGSEMEGFLQRRVHIKFTTPFLNLGNGQ